MGVLHIHKIPQYGVLIEKNDEIKNSLFYEIYNGAANNIADIIDGQTDSKNELFLNPCIAFVGKRGTGKSSAMCSFAHLLEDTNDNSKEWIKDKETKEKILRSKFYVLPAIDTANMGKEETILSNVSSEMFSLYNEQSESKNIAIENKRRFIESVMKVTNTAMFKNSGDWTKQGDKLLTETDKVVHLKCLFEKMVKDFFTIVKNNSSTENCYLVIQLDDLDMNIFNSFAIMEEIRNILSVKNVIVLLSVDIEQLKTVLKINFSESLHPKNNIGIEKSVNIIAKDLSYKYIEKLLPINRRHYMPELSIDQLKTHKSKNFLGDDDKNWYKMGLVSIENDTPTILNSVLHLIWRKTMMIPMCNENGDYLLLPHNLRSLCNFVIFLRKMKDVALIPNISESEQPKYQTYFEFSINDELRTNLEHNLRDFNKYVISNLEVYKTPEMNDEDEKLAESLITLIQTFPDTSLSELNRKIANDIIYSINDTDNNYYKILNKNDTLKNIYEATVYADTISMGDVLYLLGKIDRNTNCSYIRYLVQIIRTLWSIRMTSEIYVCGCNIKNTDSLESKSKFITKSFRNAVGAMIINPDTSESFLHNAKKQNHDWLVVKNSEKRAIFDVVISKKDSGVESVSTDNYSKHKWRIHMRSGEPIYREHYRKEEHYLLSHPMLAFSNLLYPELLYTDLKEYKKNGEEVKEDYKIWQHSYIMALPFYSMDYMYRLYIAFRKRAKSMPISNKESIMSKVVENMKDASINLHNEVLMYIPRISQSTDEENTLDYIFEEPLSKLEELIKNEKEILFVNLELIDKVEEYINKIEALETSSDKNTTNYWSCIIKYFKRNLSDSFTNQNLTILDNLSESDENKIIEIRKLLEILKDNGHIPAYYYREDIIDETEKDLFNGMNYEGIEMSNSTDENDMNDEKNDTEAGVKP